MSSSSNTDNLNNNQNQSYMDPVRDTVNKATGNTTAPQTQNERPVQPSGKYNQTVGSAKQSVGTLVGNESLRRAGEQQNQQGLNEEAQKHVQDWGEGVEKRVKGKVGEVLAAGQPEGGSDGKQEDDHLQWKKMHDRGKQAQKTAEANIDKRWS